jgi:hypothetical protein
MNAGVILPGVFVGVLWRWLCLQGFDARAALLAANAAVGVLVIASTEILSFFQQIQFTPLFIFWSVCSAAVLILLARTPGAFIGKLPSIALTRTEKIFIGAAVLIVIVIGFIALYAPPNTWDSMTYHMARVAHWRQNLGVMNYPTHIIRQLVYLPFAEYCLLHLQVLSGGDRFSNLVQWWSLIIAALGVSAVAGRLGTPRAGQIFAGLMVVTLPMAILQGSSTQNDLVAAAEIISTVFFIMMFAQTGARRWVVLAAAGAGCAVLTKGYSVFLLAPFMLMGLLAGVPVRRKLFFLSAVGMAIVVLAAPFCSRLLQIGSDPAAVMDRGGDVVMERKGLRETASNVLRNASTQLALPWRPWNDMVERAVIRAHRVLGVDVEAPATTSGTPYRLWYYLDEDYMPNPWHFGILIAAAVVFWRMRSKETALRAYAAACVSGIIFFCAVIKWQPWISRFHLPLFVIALPLAAVILARSLSPKVMAGIGVFLVLAGLHPLILNNTRQLVSQKAMFHFSREQNYFMKHSGQYQLVSRVTGFLKGIDCREAGLKIGPDGWEYPWQALGGAGVRIEHVDVANGSEKFRYPLGEFHPCAVLDFVDSDHKDIAVFNGRRYFKVANASTFTLYQRESGQ